MLSSEIQKCKLCGGRVRVIRRLDGAADHYEALTLEDTPTEPMPPRLGEFLRAARAGKRTVAIVGSAWTTRGWAPYGEGGVEVWCLNEMHGQEGVGKPTRWFQIHPKVEFTKPHRFGHWEWLRQEHEFPIFMQRQYDAVPSSTRYPLREVQRDMLTNLWRGEERVHNVFGCTMAYCIALALHEARFDRIELFGADLTLEGEWAYQRESMAFWVGKAEGMGIEVWMPEQCELFKMPLYGYEEIRKGDGSIVLPCGTEK